jgi:hypothetical protein
MASSNRVAMSTPCIIPVYLRVLLFFIILPPFD